MSYRVLLENLKALPEEQRQLAAGVYIFRDGSGAEVCGCVLGKGLPPMRPLFERWNLSNFEDVMEDSGRTARDLLPPGSDEDELHDAQQVNDGFRLNALSDPEAEGVARFDNAPDTRRARYAHMVTWLEVQIAERAESARHLALQGRGEP